MELWLTWYADALCVQLWYCSVLWLVRYSIAVLLCAFGALVYCSWLGSPVYCVCMCWCGVLWSAWRAGAVRVCLWRHGVQPFAPCAGVICVSLRCSSVLLTASFAGAACVPVVLWCVVAAWVENNTFYGVVVIFFCISISFLSTTLSLLLKPSSSSFVVVMSKRFLWSGNCFRGAQLLVKLFVLKSVRME